MKAVLFGPFVGEFYWEAGRFTPVFNYYKHVKYKDQNVKFIVLTRQERFDLYGENADILVPLVIEGDYVNKRPECFRLINMSIERYEHVAQKFFKKYRREYNVVEHIYPNINRTQYLNKNQYPRNRMRFEFKPRKDNFKLVNKYIPDDKPLVVFGSRFRKGFPRNWDKWPQFYDAVFNDKDLMDNFNFVLCGKPGEYVPDEKNRFYDMNNIKLTENSSLVGLLLAILSRACLTFGSQSAIPNISLLYRVEVLEFGCEKNYHTKTYNVTNTPITFLVDRQYKIGVGEIMKHLKKMLQKKRRK
jgi:hypothetical protein